MKKHRYLTQIVLFFVIFICLGICASVLTDRAGAKLDLTENKLYTLSDETLKVLDDLQEPVEITVLNQGADFPIIVKNLLDSYASRSSQIDITYCDPYREPKLIRELQNKGFRISENDVIVRSADGEQALSLDSLYEMDDSGSRVVRLTGEQKITSAIYSATHPERRTVLFTDGHGEEPSAALMALFENNHYQTSYSELSVLGIGEDTALIVICAPKRDASEEEIAMLKEYMEQGGAVLCFMEPGTSGLTRFADFLAERGIGLTDDVISDPSLSISGNKLNIVAAYGNHEINNYFTDNRLYVIAPSSSAVDQLYVKQGRTETGQVLRSSPSSYTSPGETGSKGLCVSSARTVTDASGNQSEERLVVFGSKLIYGDDLMGESKLANGDFILQTISWLANDEDLINVPAKDLESDILPATDRLSNRYTVVMIVVILAILVSSFVIYFRRRYL